MFKSLIFTKQYIHRDKNLKGKNAIRIQSKYFYNPVPLPLSSLWQGQKLLRHYVCIQKDSMHIQAHMFIFSFPQIVTCSTLFFTKLFDQKRYLVNSFILSKKIVSFV